jgi:hypothetical protein
MHNVTISNTPELNPSALADVQSALAAADRPSSPLRGVLDGLRAFLGGFARSTDDALGGYADWQRIEYPNLYRRFEGARRRTRLQDELDTLGLMHQ